MAADTLARNTEPDDFGVLGPLEVLRSGRAVPLGGPRQRAVLALLLLEANRVVSMDRLAEDVWGGHPPEEWANTLQTYVFHLRQALEPGRARGGADGVLVTSGRGYVLRVGREQLDAARFEDGFTAGRAALEAGRYREAAGTLRAALSLWRGPVLADLADYAFTRPEAARLEELRLAALEARIDADLALGRHDALTAELERLAAEHPLRERLHGQLMLALYRCGRQADALAAYRPARDLLAGELGIDPGEPLRRLHASVLAHDPALDWHLGGRAAAEDNGLPTEPSAASPEGGFRPHPTGRRELDWVRHHARRLLVIGSALAVAAAVGIVVVARPWAVQQTSLPANSVGLIDPAGGRAGAPVSVGSPDGLAYGDGSVWAVDSADNTLFRINPATHAVIGQIPVGAAPSAVTVTRGGNVWTANSGEGTVSRVNAAASKVVQTIPVGNVPVAIASGPSGVWVANQGDDTVRRINPATDLPSSPISVGARPDGIAVGPDAVWVANSQDGTVTRIDPVTGQPSGPVFVGAGPAGITVTPSAVWVANSLDLSVTKIDPVTGRVTATIPVGDGPDAIIAGRDGVWVGDEFGATLAHIDPGTGQVRKIFVGSSPHGLALTSAGVWVAARPFAAASHRGGTLTVASGQPAGTTSIDPAVAYDPETFHVLIMVYDGLVGLRRTDGAAGLTLVPDLATELPRPTDGGRTYTFTLRRGIRYSTGALVRPSDIRRGMEQEFTTGGGFPAYFAGVVGASACLPASGPPARCDLSRGIVTDNTAYTVTIHLTAPDPDFLYKLTNFVKAAPPGAPATDTGAAPLPATGPYMISHYHKGQLLTLARNRYFHQWSFAAQPAGYPDMIRFTHVAGTKAQIDAVNTGRADLVDFAWPWDSPQPGLLAGLAVRYPTRLHSDFTAVTEYEALNTRIPPFNDVRARQALNYAVDRSKLVAFGGGPARAAATCQILPPNFPGRQPYCPYTLHPGPDGTWQAPDLATARRRIAASHTAGSKVRLWSPKGPVFHPAGEYFAELLRQLGYRVTVRETSSLRQYSQLFDSRQQVQIFFTLLGADYPTASDFFTTDLTCASFKPATTNNSNAAEYCNPAADSLIHRAQAAQATDPAAARRLWAEADRTITNDAPWVPLVNDKDVALTSARVGNYQDNPMLGPLLDQMWTR
jgi:YVTN family beta-propeller protein